VENANFWEIVIITDPMPEWDQSQGETCGLSAIANDEVQRSERPIVCALVSPLGTLLFDSWSTSISKLGIGH
jgi:hypothetical protein